MSRDEEWTNPVRGVLRVFDERDQDWHRCLVPQPIIDTILREHELAKKACLCEECLDCDALILDHQRDDYPGSHFDNPDCPIHGGENSPWTKLEAAEAELLKLQAQSDDRLAHFDISQNRLAEIKAAFEGLADAKLRDGLAARDDIKDLETDRDRWKVAAVQGLKSRADAAEARIAELEAALETMTSVANQRRDEAMEQRQARLARETVIDTWAEHAKQLEAENETLRVNISLLRPVVDLALKDDIWNDRDRWKALAEDYRDALIRLHNPKAHQTKAEYEQVIGHSAPAGYWREPVEWCSECQLIARYDAEIKGQK